MRYAASAEAINASLRPTVRRRMAHTRNGNSAHHDVVHDVGGDGEPGTGDDHISRVERDTSRATAPGRLGARALFHTWVVVCTNAPGVGCRWRPRHRPRRRRCASPRRRRRSRGRRSARCCLAARPSPRNSAPASATATAPQSSGRRSHRRTRMPDRAAHVTFEASSAGSTRREERTRWACWELRRRLQRLIDVCRTRTSRPVPSCSRHARHAMTPASTVTSANPSVTRRPRIGTCTASSIPITIPGTLRDERQEWRSRPPAPQRDQRSDRTAERDTGQRLDPGPVIGAQRIAGEPPRERDPEDSGKRSRRPPRRSHGRTTRAPRAR